MIDEASMRSVLDHGEEWLGYVIAIDANSEKSEQVTALEENGENGIRFE